MTAALDRTRAEAFAGQMVGLFNHAMLSVLVSIGHRTGLFDAMARLTPARCRDIAAAAGLDERYVREWLAAMVAGGIVEHDGVRGAYHLPAEHAASLTREAGEANLAALSQYPARFGELEDRLVDCFKSGGGLPPSELARVHELDAAGAAALLDAHLVGGILPLAPDAIERLRAGIDVLLAGRAALHGAGLLARAFPASRTAAGTLAAPGGPASVNLVAAFGALADLPAPEAALAAVREALRPGGVFLCAELTASSHLADNLDRPLAPALYACSTLNSVAVALAAGGAGLGAMWGEERARSMMLAAGFADLVVRRIAGDPLHTYFVARVPFGPRP